MTTALVNNLPRAPQKTISPQVEQSLQQLGSAQRVAKAAAEDAVGVPQLFSQGLPQNGGQNGPEKLLILVYDD